MFFLYFHFKHLVSVEQLCGQCFIRKDYVVTTVYYDKILTIKYSETWVNKSLESHWFRSFATVQFASREIRVQRSLRCAIRHAVGVTRIALSSKTTVGCEIHEIQFGTITGNTRCVRSYLPKGNSRRILAQVFSELWNTVKTRGVRLDIKKVD